MEEEIETRTARIKNTMLGFEDHGIPTFYLYLDYGGGLQQGAGGYSLNWKKETASGLMTETVIFKILEVVGVEKWEDLKGYPIRAKCNNNKVYAIGHFLEDRWLDFPTFFAKYVEK